MTVADISDQDVHTDGTDTSGTLTVGESVTGRIDFAHDRDWFETELEARTTYRVQLKGRHPDGTVNDPYFRGVHDSQGNLIPGTQSRDYRGTSSVEFVTQEGGTYYLAAGAEGPRTGTYTLSIEEVSSGSGDDYTADTMTTGVVTVGGSISAELQANTDRDWFRVTLEAGTVYRIDLEGRSADGTLSRPHLFGVHDSNGDPIAGTASRPAGYWGEGRAFFTPTEDGTYYLSAGNQYGDRGTYTVSVTNVSAADVQTATTGTSGTVTVGGSVDGRIDYPGDRDWFGIELVAQRSYWIDLTGGDIWYGRLDPYLRGVHDSEGNLIEGTTDNDSGRFDHSRVKFTAPESGTYYIAAGGDGRDVGTYRLKVTEAARDLQTAGTDTDGTLGVGSTVRGEINHARDRDWFAVTMEAGTVYRFDLHGRPSGKGTLSHPRLDGVYDSQGNWAGNGSELNGNFAPSHIFGRTYTPYIRMHYKPDQDGTYYVSVSSRRGNETGTYEVSLVEVDPYTGGTDTTGTVTVDESVASALDYWGDRDWFSVTLEGGALYRIGVATQRDPNLSGIYDSQGRRVTSTAPDWLVFDGNTAYFRPGQDGTYYVSVGDSVNRVGSYRLTVADISDQDAHTDGTDTSGTLTVGESVTGRIDFAHDRDWFETELEAWTTYRVQLKGRHPDGTVNDPYFRGVHDSQGNLIPGTQSRDYRGASSVEFVTQEGGTYYLAAGAEGLRTGTYTLSIEEVTDSL